MFEMPDAYTYILLSDISSNLLFSYCSLSMELYINAW